MYFCIIIGLAANLSEINGLATN